MSQEVEIIARGAVGSGKSGLIGEIENLLKVLRVPYRHGDPEAWKNEVNLTGADWIGELERTKPVVVLREERLMMVDLQQGPLKEAYEAGQRGCILAIDILRNPYLAELTSSTAPQAIAWLIGYNAQMIKMLNASRGTPA